MMASIPNMRSAPLPVPTGKTLPAARRRSGRLRRAARRRCPGELIAGGHPVRAGRDPAPDGARRVDADDRPSRPMRRADAAQLGGARARCCRRCPRSSTRPAQPAAPAASRPDRGRTRSPDANPEDRQDRETPTPPPQSRAAAGAGRRAARRRRQADSAEAPKPDATTAPRRGAEPAATLDAAGKEAIAIAKRAIEAVARGGRAGARRSRAEGRSGAGRVRARHGHRRRPRPRSSADSRWRRRRHRRSTRRRLRMPRRPPATARRLPPTAPAPADLAVERKLDLARDAEWLDRLARDIAQAGGQ